MPDGSATVCLPGVSSSYASVKIPASPVYVARMSFCVIVSVVLHVLKVVEVTLADFVVDYVVVCIALLVLSFFLNIDGSSCEVVPTQFANNPALFITSCPVTPQPGVPQQVTCEER
jgi:hypothetical protein